MKDLRVLKNCKGITLIEAMVGLLILAMGLLSLARFHSSLIASSGLTKSRAEAVAFAQDKTEELRNNILEANYTGLTTSSDTPAGTNASFARTWTIATAAFPARTNIDVTVGWTDAQSTAQTIRLNSIIAWDDPAASATNDGTAFTNTGALGTPTGTGRLNTTGLTATLTGTGTTGADGVEIVTDGTITEIHDGSGALLYTGTPGVILITGNVSLDQASSPAISTDSGTTTGGIWDTRVITSDAGLCIYPIYDNTYVDPDTAATNPVLTDSAGDLVPNGAPIPPSAEYPARTTDLTGTLSVKYNCYVADNWYGRIGVLGQHAHDGLCPYTYQYITNASLAGGANWTPTGDTSGLVGTKSAQDLVITRDLVAACNLAPGGTIMISGTADASGSKISGATATDGTCTTSSSGTDTYNCVVTLTSGNWTGTITVSHTKNSGAAWAAGCTGNSNTWGTALTTDTTYNFTSLACSD